MPDEWKEQYRNCRYCGKPLDDRTFAWACRRFEKACCSSECLSAERLARYACCNKAVFIYCVCEAATSCTVHGIRHHGTHE